VRGQGGRLGGEKGGGIGGKIGADQQGPSMSQTIEQFSAGQRVAVTQQIPQRERVWTTRFEGVVERAEQKKTGSWFAHSKDDKLWLDRLKLVKDDGEVVWVNLDRYTHVEKVAGDSEG